MTFAKIGMFTIGGGYAMIPLIEREIVKKRWMSKEDFMEMFALTQSLPGVFAVNISIFVGYKLHKVKGSLVCALATILPSFVIIMLIAMFVIMYFFMIRPQNKKQKEIANFRKSLQVNQKVITAGGIHGVIKEINDNDVVLEIASNVKIRIDKNSIFAAAADANSSQASK